MFSDLVLYNVKNQKKLGFSNFIRVEIKKIKSKDQLKSLNPKDLNIVLGGDLNREVLENRKVDVLLSPEISAKKDFLHHRNSGLNHILCKIAKKNKVAIGINFNDILNLNPVDRGLRIGRIMQNIRLCRKYKVNIIAGTYARNEYELRNLTDLVSFLESIGSTTKEAKDSFRNILGIMENNKGFIAEGLKIIK